MKTTAAISKIAFTDTGQSTKATNMSKGTFFTSGTGIIANPIAILS